MAKLTETFNDRVQREGGNFHPIEPKTNGGTGSAPHIEPPHEPLPNEQWTLNQPPPFITGMSPVAETQKKIALIGTAPSSRLLAPFSDPTWTIWGCSPGNMKSLPRQDAWFELHGNLLWPENKHYGEPYLEWLKTLSKSIPVYMQSQEWVPDAKVFPMEDMVKTFGRDFFTSSFSWMMAYAIDQGATELALYGIDMASRDEYILQRPGFYFFKYMAEQKGIKVFAPNESDIMQPPGLYGYSDVRPMGRKILAREQEIKSRLANMKQEKDRLDHNITYLEGAAEDLDYFKSIWSGQG